MKIKSLELAEKSVVFDDDSFYSRLTDDNSIYFDATNVDYYNVTSSLNVIQERLNGLFDDSDALSLLSSLPQCVCATMW